MLLRTRAILVVVVGTVMGVSLSFSGGLLASRPQPAPDADELQQARVLAEVMARVKRDYVEPVDDSILLENAIRGMIGDLDAHSQYLDADEYRDIRISTSGSYTGIGIEIGTADGEVRVITPMAGSPAARAGVRSGDLIIAVDGTAIDSAHLHETISRMRGRAGSMLTARIVRVARTGSQRGTGGAGGGED